MIEHLQINDVAPCVHYDADGVQAAFTFPFALFKAADLDVWVDRARVSGGFSVSGVGITSGGAVLFAVPPAAGTRVTLRRRMALERVTDFQTDGIIRAKSLNDELDYQVAAVQQVADDVARCVKRPFTSASTADLSLPEPVAGRVLKWNDDGNGLTNSDADPDALGSASASAQAAAAAAVTAADTASAAAAAAVAAAQQASDMAGAFGNPLDKAANLADLPDKPLARQNLGLGSAAQASLGTAAGQVPTADQVAALVPASVPTGSIVMSGGAATPDGWLPCNGAAVSRTTYAALFAVIGTAFGAGDGSTTFALPDLRGRAPIGAGQGAGLTNRSLGQKLGAETHTLSTAEMPSHLHAMGYGGAGSSVGTTPVTGNIGAGPGYDTSAVGGGGAHNNMPPVAAVNFIIKT